MKKHKLGTIYYRLKRRSDLTLEELIELELDIEDELNFDDLLTRDRANLELYLLRIPQYREERMCYLREHYGDLKRELELLRAELDGEIE